MSDQRCEACGELTSFNHSLSASGRWGHACGFNDDACERAAEVREQMPVLYDMAIQSLVEIEEVLGQFVCRSDDADWEDPKALQRLIVDACHLSSEGVRTETRWRESLEGAA